MTTKRTKTADTPAVEVAATTQAEGVVTQEQHDLLRKALDLAGHTDVKIKHEGANDWQIILPTTGEEKYPKAAVMSLDFPAWPTAMSDNFLAQEFTEKIADMRLYMAGTHPDQIDDTPTGDGIEAAPTAAAVITPTVGRRVHFYPNEEHQAALGVFDAQQPCDAGVIYVWDDRCVNLEVTGPSGTKLFVQNVRLVQGNDVYISDESRAEWMPYQTKQAGAATGA